jgi:enoyl-CoA hydratase/carnithine racemase
MVHKETDGDIGILLLDNPPQNYLLTPEFIAIEELRGWINNNQIKGLVISGMGRHFSGGADLDSLYFMAENEQQLAESLEKGKRLLNYLEDMNIPVAAAINGVCFGGGLEIALACHLRIGSTKSLFAFPETNYNMIPGLSGTYRLRERLSFKDSLKMILSGDMINAEDALILKVIDTITEDENPLSYTINLLKKITEGRELKVINYVMQALKNSKKLPLEEAMHKETRMFCELARIESNRRKNAL